MPPPVDPEPVPVPVPKPRPDNSKAVIEDTFMYLVARAASFSVIPKPAVYQQMDEWLGADLSSQFKIVCESIFEKLGG